MAEQLKTRYIQIRLIFDDNVSPTKFAGGYNTKVITCNSGANQLTADIDISMYSGLQPGIANIVIYGLSIDDINAFSRINLVGNLMYQNWVEIYAGYNVDNSGLPPLVFRGQVAFAGANFNDPNRPFKIYSVQNVFTQNSISSPTSIEGDISINSMLSNF